MSILNPPSNYSHIFIQAIFARILFYWSMFVRPSLRNFHFMILLSEDIASHDNKTFKQKAAIRLRNISLKAAAAKGLHLARGLSRGRIIASHVRVQVSVKVVVGWRTLHGCYLFSGRRDVIRTTQNAQELKIHLAITSDRVVTETSSFNHRRKKPWRIYQ